MKVIWLPGSDDGRPGTPAIVMVEKASDFASVRSAVPSVSVFRVDGTDAVLRLDVTSVAESDDVADCLWDFIGLPDDAEPELFPSAVEGFARRYGVLGHVPLPASSQTATTDGAVEEGHRSSTSARDEPIEAWRMVAQGFSSILSIAARIRQTPRAADDEHRHWTSAEGAIAGIRWAIGQGSEADARNSEGLQNRAVLGALSTSERTRLHEAVDEILRLAGVARQDSAGRRVERRQVLGITARGRVRGGDGPFLVDSVLPVLASMLAQELEEASVCSWCKKPTHHRKRRRRKGAKFFYGDHEGCRALARAKTMTDAEDKRGAKRAAARSASDSQVDSQTAG